MALTTPGSRQDDHSLVCAEEAERDLQRRGAEADRHGVLSADVVGEHPFDRVVAGGFCSGRQDRFDTVEIDAMPTGTGFEYDRTVFSAGEFRCLDCYRSRIIDWFSSYRVDGQGSIFPIGSSPCGSLWLAPLGG